MSIFYGKRGNLANKYFTLSGKYVKNQKMRTQKLKLIVFLIIFASFLSGCTNSSAYSNKTCTVTVHITNFWENAEEFDKTYVIQAGSKIGLPVPVGFDYTFADWYTDPAFSRKFDTGTEGIFADTELFARFTKNIYTVTLADPSLYLNSDGTLNANYAPQVIRGTVGSAFTFPAAPSEDAALGEFKGWSLSMHYKQPDNNYGSNIIAEPNQRFENFLWQNVTYWAAWENWDMPKSSGGLSDLVNVDFRFDFPSDAVTCGTPFLTPPHPDDKFPAYLPLTLPAMPYTVLNTGLTSYSFGGWALERGKSENVRIYRDGEAVVPNTLNFENGKLVFYAIWTETRR
jgi:hypothetical protein